MDVGRLQPEFLRRVEIAGVRGDHHDGARLDVPELRSHQIGFAIRLVALHDLGREYGVPGQARLLGHVGQQRHVAVRQRRNDEFLLEPRETLNRVRPRLEPMPHVVQVPLLFLGQVLDLVLDEQLVEDHAVQRVELRPGQVALAHAVHRRAVAPAPRVGELRPVDGQPLRLAEALAFRNQRPAPVDDRAEGIEHEDAHTIRLRRCLRCRLTPAQQGGGSQGTGDELAAIHRDLFRTMLKNENTFDKASRFCETKSEWSPPFTSR